MGYNWKFTTVGGVTRVSIESGEDIAHLSELDQKLWTVLSCPVKGLEIDEETLRMVDVDGDGKIHANDVIATSQWLSKALGNLNCLLKREDTIDLTAFNDATDEGRALKSSAKQILMNLGLKKDSISVADTSDSIAIFAKTRLNGDGVVTPASTDDAALQNVITNAIATVGGVQDRSGVDGVNAELTENFYAQLAAYTGWIEAGQADKDSVFPFGDDTEAAWNACSALKSKIADYFMRCKLADFHSESAGVLDVTNDRIGSISGKDLSACGDEISEYPLAKVTPDCLLPLNGGINPAWKPAFDTLKSALLDKLFAGKESISEGEWLSVVAKFDAFNAWKAAEAGQCVASLGYDAAKQLLADNRKEDLLKLIADDMALKAESDSIDAVNKLTHLYRDFCTLLCNFVTLSDFYSHRKLAMFQAGTLYIDQRSCDLCIKVSDMGNHNATAGLSNMFIVYCNCVSKHSAETMTIAAVVTGGDVSNLREGKNGIFYDRNGLDWDASIIKVIDNPISIRQSFWRPYRRFGQFIEDTINKFASDKDAKAMDNLTSTVPAADAPEKKAPFDVAKFAGIFAALGLAFAGLMKVFESLIGILVSLKWYQYILVVLGIMIVISGPAMIMAWLKLRKRNLSPLLNANGWAVNAKTLVNIPFGGMLTKVARAPRVSGVKDPFAEKKHTFLKVLLILIIVLAILWPVLARLGVLAGFLSFL